MEKVDVFYVGYNKKVYSTRDMENAFYITTGLERMENEPMYLKFLYFSFGDSIKSYFPGTLENFLKYDCKLRAIIAYREKYQCSLVEARDTVNWLLANSD